ncbi:unnamed protein product, partial [Prunus brigantina]
VGPLQTVTGRRRAMAPDGGGGRWPTAGSDGGRWSAAGVRQWWLVAGSAVEMADRGGVVGDGGWLDMDMWHSMFVSEGVVLCVILIFFNDIFVKLGTTFWSLALC